MNNLNENQNLNLLSDQELEELKGGITNSSMVKSSEEVDLDGDGALIGCCNGK